MEYNIRKLDKHEMSQVHEMVCDVNWNSSLTAIEECYSINPDHVYGAVTPEGKVLSHCLWLPLGGMLSNKVAFLGLFITRKEYRYKGIGKSVLKKCVDSIGNMGIGVFTSMVAQPIYRSMGFNYTGLQTRRYWSPISREKREVMTGPFPAGFKILNIHDVSHEAVIRYDREYIHPMPRDVVLNLLIKQHHSFHVAIEDGNIVGYGCVRKARVGYKVKPLYANNEQIARALFNLLIDSIPCQEMIELQVIIEHEKAKLLFEKYGIVRDEKQNLQMFTKEIIIPPNMSFVYGMMDYMLTLV